MAEVSSDVVASFEKTASLELPQILPADPVQFSIRSFSVHYSKQLEAMTGSRHGCHRCWSDNTATVFLFCS